MAVTAVARRLFSIPLFELGFRPFYLLGALLSALAVPFWLASFAGLLPEGGYLTAAAWHSHEMIFGFGAAIIVGFLFTAVANWSGLPTPGGPILAGFAGLWILGRISILTGPGPLAAAVDLLFLPLAAFAVAIPLLRSRSYRNLFTVVILLLLFGSNALFHREQLAPGPDVDLSDYAVMISVDVIALLMAVIGGRIIPLFTANAVPEARPRRYRLLEVLSIVSLLAILGADAFTPWVPPATHLLVPLFVLAALVHGLRLCLWSPFSTRREALLWILPLSYSWIPIALALRAAALLSDEIPVFAATHAMTAGAMGGLMLAMMMRSSKGHTGRPLTASGTEALALIFVPLAAVTRVFPPLILPEQSMIFYAVSAVFWSAAFLIFFCRYWPILTRPRVDSPMT